MKGGFGFKKKDLKGFSKSASELFGTFKTLNRNLFSQKSLCLKALEAACVSNAGADPKGEKTPMKSYLLILCLLSIPASASEEPNRESPNKAFSQSLWTYRGDGPFSGAPIHDQGVLYLGDRIGVLHAVDAETGMEQWRFQAGGALDGSPSTDGTSLYFLSRDGFCYGLNAKTGALKWKFKTGGEQKKDYWDYYLSTPVLDGDRLYFGSGDHHVYALNAATGHLIWSFKTEGIVHGIPAADAEHIYIGGFGGDFYALKKADGAQVWKFRTVGNGYFQKGAVQGSPALHNNTLYFGSRDYNIYAVNAKTGRGVWNERTPSWVVARPLVDGDGVYFGNSEEPALFAMHAGHGKRLWNKPVGLNTFAEAAVSGDRLYFASFNGVVYGVNKDGSNLKHVFQTASSEKNDHHFFNDGGQLRKEVKAGARTLADIEAIYQRFEDELGAILAAPLIVDHVMYVATTEGRLHALK